MPLIASQHTHNQGRTFQEIWKVSIWDYNQLLFQVYLNHITLSNIGRTFSWTKHDQIHTILLIVFIPRTFQAEITSIFLDLVCEAVRLPYPARREPWAHFEFRPRFVLAVWISCIPFSVFFFPCLLQRSPKMTQAITQWWFPPKVCMQNGSWSMPVRRCLFACWEGLGYKGQTVFCRDFNVSFAQHADVPGWRRLHARK